MYFLHGLRRNLETLLTLVKPHLAGGSASAHEIERAYRRMLARQQPSVPQSRRGGVEVVRDEERRQALASLFADPLAPGAPPDLAPLDERIGFVERGLGALSTMDKDLGALFRLVVEVVYVPLLDAAGSSTINTAIGAVRMNPQPSWTEVDVIEASVHELTHTLLFLDELRYGHHPDRELLDLPENLSLTGIKNERRPVSVVAHSIVVAAELLLLRRRHLPADAAFVLHPDTAVVVEAAGRALRALRAMSSARALVSARLWEILDGAGAVIEREAASPRESRSTMSSS